MSRDPVGDLGNVALHAPVSKNNSDASSRNNSNSGSDGTSGSNGNFQNSYNSGSSNSPHSSDLKKGMAGNPNAKKYGNINNKY